ncbi:ClpP family protease [Coraliomargarita parva]|uniref:ClpP family protease n=1 Tax=Coraliomargarita parva TaxID=3014050 RepID=UPI0022B3040B|nr:ATP-dependent Clp protease proteolytic subunit [Coraliomargarita parva]
MTKHWPTLVQTGLIAATAVFLAWYLKPTSSVNYLGSDDDLIYLLDTIAEAGITTPHEALDQELLKSRKILLTNSINASSTKHVVASLLLLNEQDPQAPIDFYVRTNGGYYDDAFAVVDTMRTIEAPVNTYALGGSHSSGTIIVASGTGTRAAYRNSLMMAHDNLSEEYGSYAMEDRENKRIRSFWAAYDKIPQDWFTTPGDSYHYLNAEEALSMGLIDAILPQP